MHALGGQGDEVPEIVVGGLGLGETAVGLFLGSVDEVGELDRVLNEEYRNVVADDVPVAFLGIQLDGETPYVPGQIP